MRNKCILLLPVLILFLYSDVFSLPKDITIQGTVIYNQDYLVRAADIDTIPASKFTFGTIAAAITKFYHDNGYTLARVLLVRETLASIAVFVDEGRLNRIVFKNLNSLDTLRIQYDFSLPNRIYHTQTVDKQLEKLKKKYAIKDFIVTLQESKDYSSALFQIDRLSKPFTDGKLPLVPTIPAVPDPHYDLIITIVAFSPEESGGFTYGLDTSFSLGLIPYVRYTHNDLIQRGDSFRIGFKTGFMYGLDGNFTSLPYNTFNQIKSTYNFRSHFDGLFIPRVSSEVYNSKAGRKDLGLDQYRYVRVNVLAEPGFTPIEKLKVYPGYGVEKVFILQAVKNPDTAVTQPNIAKDTQVWHFIGIKANIDLIPFSLKHTTGRKITLEAYRYQNATHFYKVGIDTIVKFEFFNFDLFVFQGDYTYLNDPVPFYYEEPVSTRTFKGFMGKDYHTTHIARASFEYEISIHRDFIYTGVYNDFTAFKGKYLLHGNQIGIAYGLSFHYVFFEQFEFALWWGKDYLPSTDQSGYNLKFTLAKKW
ncbi:MAG TPA: hypothetical protein PLV81_12955 [Spirochaetota bacterium]|nr:hypothetical protein [Spirochaetota bacterium]